MIWWLLALVVLAGILAYHRANAWMWAAAVAILLVLASLAAHLSRPVIISLWVVFGLVTIVTVPTAIRRTLISKPLLRLFRRILPRYRRTEQEALEAGTVWWDGELFSGDPDWNKLLAFPRPALTAEEKAFLDGPVEEVCAMLNDWQITHELHDLPPEVWQFIKDQGFLGMIIPKQYGGLGFSALAHSEVVTKLTTRSGTAAVSVMVPNSLGPAELLLHYGTEAQKNYYLPRLAQRARDAVLRAHEPRSGLGRGRHSGFRRRVPRGMGGQGERSWHPADLGEALYHAGSDRDVARPRVSPVRSRPPAWAAQTISASRSR